jgi:predicted  nucleic acid-binding Zn-ribbon protein
MRDYQGCGHSIVLLFCSLYATLPLVALHEEFEMADIEARVKVLEKDLAALKARVEVHNAELVNIPDLIKVEFRFVNSRFTRLDQEISEARDRMDTMDVRLGKLTEAVDRMPRVLAEVVKEMLDERDRRPR